MTLVEICITALGGLLTTFVGLLAWLGSRAVDRLERLGDSVAAVATRVSVLESATTRQRLDSHDRQLLALERLVAEIGSDVKVLLVMFKQGKEEKS